MPDIPRLTDDELDALLATHKSIGAAWDDQCEDCGGRWPCETWRLATEVEERRDEEKAKKEEGGR